MGLEFGCARGDCQFLVRSDDRDEIERRARDHMETEHQVPANDYDIEDDIRASE